MTKLKLHPRLLGLVYLLGGAAATSAIIAILGAAGGGRASNRALFVVGMGGIFAGVGLMQVLWPPPVAAQGDDRNGWKRANLVQKILYALGGVVGVVFAAVLLTLMEGKI